MDDRHRFSEENAQQIVAQSEDRHVAEATRIWRQKVRAYNYAYHFSWCGLPIIQYPQDVVAVQELIWSVKPDLVIETGVARGGSLMLSASLLALLDMESTPSSPSRKVVGIDIDIRAHNRAAIKSSIFASRITLIEGSSIDKSVIEHLHSIAEDHSRVMVLLDSNHTHDHVLQELNFLAPLVSPGSYCVVFDTVIEDMPAEATTNRSWGPGNSPRTAVSEFLKTHPEFGIDHDVSNKCLITSAPDGYLKRKT